MTYYTATSGAGVFATGTNNWIVKMAEDCPATATYICPKDALLKITTNVLNAFGLGPAGLSHPSTGTNLRDLPAGVPDTGDTSSTSVTERRRTQTTRYYTPQTRSPATSQPPVRSGGDTYTPPTDPYTTPTTRSRSLLGR